MVRRWHGSLARDAEPSVDSGTGEVRIPLALYDVDVHQGDAELVLTRREARLLLDGLATAMRAAQPAEGQA